MIIIKQIKHFILIILSYSPFIQIFKHYTWQWTVDTNEHVFLRKWKRHTAQNDNPGIKCAGFHQPYKNLQTVTYTIFPSSTAIRSTGREEGNDERNSGESFIKEQASSPFQPLHSPFY